MIEFLNGYSSRSFSIDAGILQGDIVGPTLFLIFTNALLDIINFWLDIYADNAAIYSGFIYSSVHAQSEKLWSSKI